jgi:excisionase family DNA binding protein
VQSAKDHSSLLLLTEVAAYTRTTLNTVRYWVATGKLASVKPGRRRMVLRSDLEAFVASGRINAKPANDQ